MVYQLTITGKNQSGCRWDLTGTCSHLRAFKYFAESIYAPVTFWGYPCESYEDMEKINCKGVGTRMGGEPGNYRKYVLSYCYFIFCVSKLMGLTIYFQKTARRQFIIWKRMRGHFLPEVVHVTCKIGAIK